MIEPVGKRVGHGVLELVEGDITSLEVDAVVNAANRNLQLGAGVAGAIRSRGGHRIQDQCDRIGHCPVGSAIITGGGNLPARHVIHAVGPVWGEQDPPESDRLLGSACREALARASENSLESVALPSLSTGVYGFPMERAAPIILGEAIAHLQEETSVRRLVICLFGDDAFQVFLEALQELD